MEDVLKKAIQEVFLQAIQEALPLVMQQMTVKEIQNYKLAYTTQELAEGFGTYPERISLLRKLGALQGTKNGREYIFSREEAERFLRDYRGCDLSNARMIRESIATISREKLKKPAATTASKRT